jgi:hypothetical protein
MHTKTPITYEDFLDAVRKQREHGLAVTLKNMERFFHKEEKPLVEKFYHRYMKQLDLAFEHYRSNVQDISSESLLCIMQAVQIRAAELAQPARKELAESAEIIVELRQHLSDAQEALRCTQAKLAQTEKILAQERKAFRLKPANLTKSHHDLEQDRPAAPQKGPTPQTHLILEPCPSAPHGETPISTGSMDTPIDPGFQPSVPESENTITPSRKKRKRRVRHAGKRNPAQKQVTTTEPLPNKVERNPKTPLNTAQHEASTEPQGEKETGPAAEEDG